MPKSRPEERTAVRTNNGTRIYLGFELGELLGSGGFSWVLEGTPLDRSSDNVALKFLKIFDREKQYKCFKRQRKEVNVELDILKSMSHDNVVKLHAFQKIMYESPNGAKVPTFCFALEKCTRFDLFDYLYLTGKFEESLAQAVFKQVVQGLSALHAAGFAHRDLKAQNILFGADFQVKIGDFGSGKRLESNVMMNSCKVGTLGHQAPEVLLSRPYTKKSDIFSLGVCLFITVAGHPPFKQALITDPWFRCLAKSPAQHRRFWAAHKNDVLSDSLMNLIQGMLCYQPVRRLLLKKIEKHEWIKSNGIDKDTFKSLMQARSEQCIQKELVCSNSFRTNKFEEMY